MEAKTDFTPAEEQEIRRTLTGVLIDIYAAAGLEATLKIAASKGNRYLRIVPPPRLNPTGSLCAIVGYDSARKIVDHFDLPASIDFYVPIGPMGSGRILKREAMRLFSDGASGTLVSRTIGVAKSTALIWKREFEAANQNGRRPSNDNATFDSRKASGRL